MITRFKDFRVNESKSRSTLTISTYENPYNIERLLNSFFSDLDFVTDFEIFVNDDGVSDISQVVVEFSHNSNNIKNDLKQYKQELEKIVKKSTGRYSDDLNLDGVDL